MRVAKTIQNNRIASLLVSLRSRRFHDQSSGFIVFGRTYDFRHFVLISTGELVGTRVIQADPIQAAGSKATNQITLEPVVPGVYKRAPRPGD
jgi:hypothetical protein